MSGLSPAAIPAFLARLSLPPSSPPVTRALLPLITATTLGHGKTWLKPCLDTALAPLPPSPSPVPPLPPFPALDASLHPRRFAIAQLKEGLVKSAILVGVPKVIETMLELNGVVAVEDRADGFVRNSLQGQTVRERAENGRTGLRSVYRHQLDPIFERMQRGGLEDLRFLSEAATYGTFLSPFSDLPNSSSPDPFASDPRLLSIVTLSALIPQRTEREILWHLRGATRRGWERDEVRQLQEAVEAVCGACGLEAVGVGMPRVEDVEQLPEEEELREVPSTP
ncbi:hypothetical protein JCM11641_006967 [Rhodosporidiobolus odoratus]